MICRAAVVVASARSTVSSDVLIVCRSVDAIANEPGDGSPTTDFDALYAGLQGDCKY